MNDSNTTAEPAASETGIRPAEEIKPEDHIAPDEDGVIRMSPEDEPVGSQEAAYAIKSQQIQDAFNWLTDNGYAYDVSIEDTKFFPEQDWIFQTQAVLAVHMEDLEEWHFEINIDADLGQIVRELHEQACLMTLNQLGSLRPRIRHATGQQFISWCDTHIDDNADVRDASMQPDANLEGLNYSIETGPQYDYAFTGMGEVVHLISRQEFKGNDIPWIAYSKQQAELSFEEYKQTGVFREYTEEDVDRNEDGDPYVRMDRFFPVDPEAINPEAEATAEDKELDDAIDKAYEKALEEVEAEESTPEVAATKVLAEVAKEAIAETVVEEGPTKETAAVSMDQSQEPLQVPTAAEREGAAEPTQEEHPVQPQTAEEVKELVQSADSQTAVEKPEAVEQPIDNQDAKPVERDAAANQERAQELQEAAESSQEIIDTTEQASQQGQEIIDTTQTAANPDITNIQVPVSNEPKAEAPAEKPKEEANPHSPFAILKDKQVAASEQSAQQAEQAQEQVASTSTPQAEAASEAPVEVPVQKAPVDPAKGDSGYAELLASGPVKEPTS